MCKYPETDKESHGEGDTNIERQTDRCRLRGVIGSRERLLRLLCLRSYKLFVEVI